MKKFIKSLIRQPWFYIVLVELLVIFVLYPLCNNPQRLYPFLAESWYDLWEEFAVMHSEGWLAICSLFLFLLAGSLTFIMPFRQKHKVLKKIMIGVLYAFLALVSLGMIASKFGSAREGSKRISCSSNLIQIGLALGQYALDNESNLPPDLKTLADTDYLTDKGIHRCPSRWRQNTEFSDYLYYGVGRKIEEKPPFILLRDRDKNHPGKYWNILMSNGNIVSTRKRPE